MSGAARLALLVVLLAAGSLAAGLRDGDTPGEPRLAAARGSLRFTDTAWRLDELLQSPPERVGPEQAPHVRLPWGELGERWSCVFAVEQPGAARLVLDWLPDSEGLVFEIVVNGERLAPARDGWRPSPTRLRSDLGTVWFGAGRQLVEFVCRETGAGALVLHALELQAP